MPVDMFLVIDGVSGESKDERHPESIDVLAWSWGMSRMLDSDEDEKKADTEKKEAKEIVNIQDISVTKWMDRSSISLYTACNKGTIFDKAHLYVIRGKGDKEKFISYTMEKVKITSCSTGGSGGEDRLTENISLSFKKIEWIYHLPKELQTETEKEVIGSCDVPEQRPYKPRRGYY